MATLNGNKIIGYAGITNTTIEVFTESPTGGTTDSLQFRMTFDTPEQLRAVEAVMHELYRADREELTNVSS